MHDRRRWTTRGTKPFRVGSVWFVQDQPLDFHDFPTRFEAKNYARSVRRDGRR
jgi:hypothetical protein